MQSLTCIPLRFRSVRAWPTAWRNVAGCTGLGLAKVSRCALLKGCLETAKAPEDPKSRMGDFDRQVSVTHTRDIEALWTRPGKQCAVAFLGTKAAGGCTDMNQKPSFCRIMLFLLELQTSAGGFRSVCGMNSASHVACRQLSLFGAVSPTPCGRYSRPEPV